MALLASVEASWLDVLRISKGSVDVVKWKLASDQEFFLNQAGRRFKNSQYAEFALELQAYAAAHFAQMARTEPAGLGPSSTASIGDVSSGNTLPVLNTDELWGETIYGRAVKKLIAQAGFPMLLVFNPKKVTGT